MVRDLPILNDEQLRSLVRHPEAWELWWEYLGWRRRAGLEPPRERVNRWYAAWDTLGEKKE